MALSNHYVILVKLPNCIRKPRTRSKKRSVGNSLTCYQYYQCVIVFLGIVFWVKWWAGDGSAQTQEENWVYVGWEREQELQTSTNYQTSLCVCDITQTFYMKRKQTMWNVLNQCVTWPSLFYRFCHASVTCLWFEKISIPASQMHVFVLFEIKLLCIDVHCKISVLKTVLWFTMLSLYFL